MKKKLLSYNVNGIRAALNKGLAGWLTVEAPDILAVQETKAMPEQVDTTVFENLGYHHYWASAEKKGYSGVAFFTRFLPDKVVYGMDNGKYDSEGRVIQVDYGDISFINVYFPSGTTGDVRQQFKMEFLFDFHKYVNKLRETRTNLIIAGDFNICRLWIDIHNPEKQQNTSGFLPEEREWFRQFVDDKYIDSFREFHPDPHHYSWWSYRAGARQKNKGWRIDYFMVTSSLKDKLSSAFILPEVKHSDHCPVGIEIDF